MKRNPCDISPVDCQLGTLEERDGQCACRCFDGFSGDKCDQLSDLLTSALVGFQLNIDQTFILNHAAHTCGEILSRNKRKKLNRERGR